jgi:DNA helicase-2/ATP-dependent DNA helicase PcrA
VRRKIPYVVRSGVRFFEQAHIKDVVAYLRALANPADELAWSRLLRLERGIVAESVRRVLAACAAAPAHASAPERLADETLRRALPASARPAVARLSALLESLAKVEVGGPGALIREIVRRHYGDHARGAFENASVRLGDLEHLAEYANRFQGLDELLDELALVAGVAAEGVLPGEPPDDRMTLSTIHQAKGLEWRHVFVLWLAEGRLPHAQALRSEADEEEERRLFYVAATRARDELYLCVPSLGESGEADPRPIVMRPSRFVEEVEGTTERWQIEEQAS